VGEAGEREIRTYERAKLYSILAPEHDGQKFGMKIKAPVPMTLGVMPTATADQVYDRPEQLSSALAQTSCKQRGVQTMEFDCLFTWPMDRSLC